MRSVLPSVHTTERPALRVPQVAHLGAARGLQVWKAAQLMFSLSISVALFSESPFGLPFAVIGFWKCGFPETTGCFRRAFRIGKVNIESLARVAHTRAVLLPPRTPP